NIQVGIAVVGVFPFASFAKKSIGFIEEQDRAGLFSCVEYLPKVLFSLANVFVRDGRKVEPIKLAAEFPRQRLYRRQPDPFVWSRKQQPRPGTALDEAGDDSPPCARTGKQNEA